MYDALAVGFAAVADAGDFDEIAAEVAEEDAVVLGAKSVERWFNAHTGRFSK